jgi:transcriptional regulator with GAF, ATPase, and Fis domain/polyferredoxin
MPKLLLQNGEQRHHEIRLAEEASTLGRGRQNDVALDDRSISRVHAQIVRRNARYLIRDLESMSGTFVNGRRIVQDHHLSHGDVIRLGSTELRFCLEDEQPIAAAAEGGPTACHTVASPRASDPVVGDARRTTQLSAESIIASLPTTGSLTGDGLSDPRFKVLTRVAEAIHSCFELDDLLRVLMDQLFEVFGPDRGAILLTEGPGRPVTQKVVRPDGGDLRISSTIVDHAIRHRSSVIVADTWRDERFREAESVVDSKIRAAICSPLIRNDDVLGAIYLDTQVNVLSYQKEDLALLDIIAAYAAVSIENAVLMREKLDTHRLRDDEPGPIVAHSEAMHRVEADIARLAGDRLPVLVTGESGTGKLFAAKAIHRASGDVDSCFVLLDCSTLSAEEAHNALFGYEADPGPADRAPGEGAIRRTGGGGLRLAEGGTLVLRHFGALDASIHTALAAHLDANERDDGNSPRTRLIATTSEDLEHLVREGRIGAELESRFAGRILKMPRVIDRKADIIPLARYFLEKCDHRVHEYAQHLNGSAERSLKSRRYRERNVAELREVVEFAAFISDGDEVGAEHVFSGPTERSSRLEVDLSGSGLVRWLIERNIPGVAQALTLAIFLAIVTACLMAGDTALGSVANAMIWGLWWPALLILFLGVGRVWCTVCPISAAGRVIRRIWRFDRPPPQWIKQYTSWLLPVLLVGIIWSEHVFHMTARPLATGYLLVTLLAASALLCVVFSREVWCRYLCPLGCVGAGYSVPSMIQIHSNRNICSTQCKTHECYKGSESVQGCPMFHHPLFLRDAHFCKLCMHCLRVCPHQSARPYFQLHLQDIWQRGELDTTLVPFSLALVFMAPMLLAAKTGLVPIHGTVPFTIASLAALALAAVLSPAIPSLLSRDRDPSIAARVGLALLLLAWGPFLAFHLQHVPGLTALNLQLEGSNLASVLPLSEVPLLSAIQLCVILLGALLSAIALWRIRSNMIGQGASGESPASGGWILLAGFCAAYAALSLGLVIVGPLGS